MHVDDDVHTQRPRPIDDLRHAVDIDGAEASAFGLEQTPGDGQTHRIEAERRHLRQIRQAERWVAAGAGVGRALAIFVTGGFERVDRTRAWTELE